MAEPASDNTADELRKELDLWSFSGHFPRLYLRDDDAIKITPHLERLTRLCERFEIPVLLAVIPKFAKSNLAGFVLQHAIITPAVHGYSHTNFAGQKEKKTELGNHRPLDNILAELAIGRDKLARMFGNRLSTLFVPPWNRVSNEVASGLDELGFVGISGFGWKIADQDILHINTHIDIIDWKNGKTEKPLDKVMGELITNLRIARRHEFSPIGILTHHLVHNQKCWEMIENLFLLLQNQREVRWVKAVDVINQKT